MVTSTAANATARKILQAATHALVHGGEGALRVDQVATAAGINKRMIYHHFGDRAGLIEAAVQSQLQLLLSAPGALSSTGKEVLRLFAQTLEPMGIDGADDHVLIDQQLSGDGLRDAARIVLAHFLVHPDSPDLVEVQQPQWQQFAAELLGYAFADVLPGPSAPAKPRYRVTSSSRLSHSRK